MWKLTSYVRTLNSIARSLETLVKLARGTNSGPPKAKLKLSRARRTQLRVQGRYLGYVRGLTTKKKATVKALKAKSGYAAAIALAKKLAAAGREDPAR